MLEPVIANSIIATSYSIATSYIVVAESDFKMILLLIGLVVLTSGLWLMWHHREHFNYLLSDLKQDSPRLLFERRKYQRRSIVGGLVASCGIVMAGFFWVQEEIAFAILLALLLLLIVGITLLAILDMLTIGIKHSIKQLAEPDTEADQVIAAASAKHHEAKRAPDVSTDD